MPEFQLENEPELSGPIPGQSLTKEPNSEEWKSPPQFDTVEQALQFYISGITSDDMHSGVVNVLRMGVPVTTLAHTFMLDGVMKGRHNIDVGILVLPVLMETIAYLGDMAEVDYIMGTEEPEGGPQQSMFVETAKDMLEKELAENQDAISMEMEGEEDTIGMEEDTIGMEEEDMPEPERAGLMGRIE